MSSPNAPQSRRTFLKRGSATVAGTAVAGGLPALALGADAVLAAGEASLNPVVRENTLTDPSTHSSDFQLKNINSLCEGYARQASVNLGESIDLVISGPNLYLPDNGTYAESAHVELYRLGYYGGKGGRLVWKTQNRVSTWQRFDAEGKPSSDGVITPNRPDDWRTGLKGRADNQTTLTIPGDAAPASGVYLAKVTGYWLEFPPGVPAVERSGESHIVFVVRDDARPRDVLALLPSNTWQAYNYWGGRSLYTYASRYQNLGNIVPVTGTERAGKVSLDRPYNNWIGDFNWVLRTEFPAIWWMEQQGYDVSYTEDVALHFDTDQALKEKSKSVVILGHGEYWTQQIRNAIQQGRDSGTAIYNFGANTGYWRVRYEDASGKIATNAAEARVLVCYKTIEGGGTLQLDIAAEADPVSPTTTFRDPGKGTPGLAAGTTAATPAKYQGVNNPESKLFGVQYIGDDDSTNRPLAVPADNGNGEFAGHRAWRHTNVPKNGTTLGTSLVGWEWDGIPTPSQPYGGAPATKAGTSLKRLSETDPRVNAPSGAQTNYLLDAGRVYGARGSLASPPVGWNPYSHAVTYTAPSGALVFSSGTIHWSWGLGPHYLDQVTDTYSAAPVDVSLQEIRQATTNLFVDGGIFPQTPVGVVVDDGTLPTNPTTPPTNPTTPPTNPTTPPTNPTTPPTNPTTPPTNPTTPTDVTAPSVSASVTNSKSLLGYYNVSKRTREVTVRVAIGSTEKSGPVKVDLVLRDSKGELGKTSISLQPGRSGTATIVISTAAFGRLPTGLFSSLLAELRVTATDTVGNARTIAPNIRLRAA